MCFITLFLIGQSVGGFSNCSSILEFLDLKSEILFSAIPKLVKQNHKFFMSYLLRKGFFLSNILDYLSYLGTVLYGSKVGFGEDSC